MGPIKAGRSFITLLPTQATHQLKLHSIINFSLRLMYLSSLLLKTVDFNRYIIVGLRLMICIAFQESHCFNPICVFSRETVWINVPVEQPVPCIGFLVLYGIYRKAINQSNFSKPGCQGCHFPDNMKFPDFSRLRSSSTVSPRPFWEAWGYAPPENFQN